VLLIIECVKAVVSPIKNKGELKMPLTFIPTWVNGFPQNAQAAVGRALTTWRNALASAVNVDITLVWGVNLPNNLTAICIPNAIENFVGAPLKNTWYPSALADKIRGQDLQGNDEDMTVFFDQNINWNVTANVPQQNEVDIESVALHEVCHGLGFVSTFWQAAWPAIGSYGGDELMDLVDLVVQVTGQQLGFPLYKLNRHPSVYGVHVRQHPGTYLTDPGQFVNPSTQLGSALVGGGLVFDLPARPVYAPNPFLPFTSIDHLDDPNSLMRPSIAAGQQTRAIDQPVLDIMRALGW
jgi:hypothetical protein